MAQQDQQLVDVKETTVAEFKRLDFFACNADALLTSVLVMRQTRPLVLSLRWVFFSTRGFKDHQLVKLCYLHGIWSLAAVVY